MLPLSLLIAAIIYCICDSVTNESEPPAPLNDRRRIIFQRDNIDLFSHDADGHNHHNQHTDHGHHCADTYDSDSAFDCNDYGGHHHH